MKRTQKLVLALSTSAILALGAVAPAFAGGPPSNPGNGTATACEVAAPQARAAIGC
jgi:type 1 fimbria pilin